MTNESFNQARNANNKILLFTGAGISVPLGLPTSTGFISEIQSRIKPITQHVINYLGSNSGQDIEWILSTLESFSTEIGFTESLLQNLAQGNAAAINSIPHIKSNLQGLKKEAAEEITRIKKLIFENLSKFDAKDSSNFYRNIILEIIESFESASISVITTNYDLTFETAIEDSQNFLKKLGIHNVDFGFRQSFGRPIYDPSQDFEWTTSEIEFLKIHGSLDWHKDARDRCSRSMSSTVPDDPDQMVILYPGFKGVPEYEPFTSLHGRLNKRLSEADHIYVVGFAFRDTYINNMFENILRLRNNFKIYYINPLSLDKHPSESMAPHLSANYSNFIHIEKAIDIEKNPIGIARLKAAYLEETSQK